jgi:hypothetical protein
VRVGNEVTNVEVQLVHNRSIFGPISGTSGVSWEQPKTGD